MKKESGNADLVVSSYGVKLHHFEPSDRKIWTVVGKENEHWIDSDLGYCSCEDYYYNAMEKGRQCYHLNAVKNAKEQGKLDVIKFHDSEFDGFLLAILNDIV